MITGREIGQLFEIFGASFGIFVVRREVFKVAAFENQFNLLARLIDCFRRCQIADQVGEFAPPRRCSFRL